MNPAEFWKIINDIHEQSQGNMNVKCELLLSTLSSLSNETLLSFSKIFDELNHSAYTWDLWAAAYILQGGCSDDSFSDFRSTLISMGESTFNQALSDPNTLAAIQFFENDCCYEGFSYVVTEVLEQKLGAIPASVFPLPMEPAGEMWDEDNVESLFPALHYLEESDNAAPPKKPWWKLW